jgi:hypothetical protein
MAGTSNQATWQDKLKIIEAKQAAAANERAAKKAAADAAAKVTATKNDIATLQTLVIGPANANISAAQKQLKVYTDSLSAYYDANSSNPNFPNRAEDIATINTLKSLMAPLNQTIAKNKATIKDANATIAKMQKTISTSVSNPNLKKKTTATAPKATTTTSTVKSVTFSEDYKYNAPMVGEAYFGNNSFEDSILEGNFVDQGTYTDARQAWKGVTGGRGTIQMDAKFLESYAISAQSKSSTPLKIDPQKYGFKFLYNPQTVSMAWGVLQNMDPNFEATGQDKFQVISTALMTSTVSFELMLNRIKDFDYVDTYGLSSGLIESPSKRSAAKNPYPSPVANKDLAEIYEKGTMYDLEYLIKTLNGPNATFTSDLNGETADRGWLRPTIVELHLGNKLRYRVRVSEFAVNHVIFNSRMVPMLSTVKLTCNRFIDGPQVNSVFSAYSGNVTSNGAIINQTPIYKR